jgi:hypothetical protein
MVSISSLANAHGQAHRSNPDCHKLSLNKPAMGGLCACVIIKLATHRSALVSPLRIYNSSTHALLSYNALAELLLLLRVGTLQRLELRADVDDRARRLQLVLDELVQRPRLQHRPALDPAVLSTSLLTWKLTT